MLEGGADCVFRSWTNASRPCSAPSRKISTPSSPFNTHPARVLAHARRYTKGRKPTPCTTPRTRMEQALATLHRLDHAGAALPSDLDDFIVFDQNGDAALALGNLLKAATRMGIGVDIVFHEIAALPFEPLPHFLRVGTACRPKKLKRGHGPAPPPIRE